jgi:glycerophosphoryl diester phosphodiesterase
MRLAVLALLLGAVVIAADTPARPRIAAHRGGALLWPENSLTAFRGALALGVDLLELDVHLSKDGEVVVIHDPTLPRTTTGEGAVRDHTWAELKVVTLRGASDERIPHLREVLALLRPARAGLLLEIKAGPDGVGYPGIEERVLRLLAETGLTERTTIMAFDWTTLERVRGLAPGMRRSALLSRRGMERSGGVPDAVRGAAAVATDLGIERTLLSPAIVAAARAAGLTIGVWTVNEPEELRAVLAAGVDYVTTDRPDLGLHLRGRP